MTVVNFAKSCELNEIIVVGLCSTFSNKSWIEINSTYRLVPVFFYPGQWIDLLYYVCRSSEDEINIIQFDRNFVPTFNYRKQLQYIPLFAHAQRNSSLAVLLQIFHSDLCCIYIRLHIFITRINIRKKY